MTCVVSPQVKKGKTEKNELDKQDEKSNQPTDTRQFLRNELHLRAEQNGRSIKPIYDDASLCVTPTPSADFTCWTMGLKIGPWPRATPDRALDCHFFPASLRQGVSVILSQNLLKHS